MPKKIKTPKEKKSSHVLRAEAEKLARDNKQRDKDKYAALKASPSRQKRAEQTKDWVWRGWRVSGVTKDDAIQALSTAMTIEGVSGIDKNELTKR